MKGHIAQRPSKRGGYLYYVVVTVDGKQRWLKPPGPPTKRNAEAYLSQVVHEVNSGVEIQDTQIAFCDFVGQFFEKYVKELAPNSQKTYRSILDNYLLPFFGQRQIADIGAEDIQHLKTTLLERVSPQSVKNTLTLLRLIFNCAIDWDYVQVNPAKKVRHPRVPRKEKDFLRPHEVDFSWTTPPLISGAHFSWSQWSVVCESGNSWR